MNLRFAFFLPFVSLLAGCSTTGDWNEDSLGFDPKKADLRLGAMRQNLREVEADTSAARKQSARLHEELAAAQSGRQGQAARAAELKKQIDSLEAEASRLTDEANAISASDQDSARRHRDLELQITLLKSSVSRARAELALILTVR